MRYGLAYKDVADWQVEWKHTNADLTALLREFVEHFEGNFEDPGLELYGRVNGQEIANGGRLLNELLDRARQVLSATPTPSCTH